MAKYLFIGSRITATHDYDTGSLRALHDEFEAPSDADAAEVVRMHYAETKWFQHPPPRLLRIEEVAIPALPRL